jgi:hypothetical protein
MKQQSDSEVLVCPHCGGILPESGGIKARTQYMLRRRGKIWQLVFEGEAAQFKHEKGATYVVRLLAERGPFHAVELAVPSEGAPTKKWREKAASLREVLELGGRVQERSAALDEREALRRLIQERWRLEAVANDETKSKVVREAARVDVEAIDAHLAAQPQRPSDNAQKTVRAVRMAIKRFCRNLIDAEDERGKPDRVLKAFGYHLWDYLFMPSSRYADARGHVARKGLAGCFLYERPKGVKWVFDF